MWSMKGQCKMDILQNILLETIVQELYVLAHEGCSRHRSYRDGSLEIPLWVIEEGSILQACRSGLILTFKVIWKTVKKIIIEADMGKNLLHVVELAQ
ncbi:hypothetical protein TSUD_126310 [Trifolium subterraneum]|uniref:Uncharacterized protein n=1 Tax=Trifolium subterraneum TaxID=3900 RepID=A0A2Z6MVF0_TRISU|nr:hypothetical protein TSUD_126310 [Trifolium subterraneum]